jgi:hypothetical protein
VLSEASKTDGIFPLITNTTLEACEVLRKYKFCGINDCVPHGTKDSNEYGKRKDRKAPNSAPGDEF